jgi:hypothetical protein
MVSKSANGEPTLRIAFPVHVVVKVEQFNKTGLTDSIVPLDSTTYGKHIAIFASADLAKRFGSAVGANDGYAIATMNTPKALRAILVDKESHGCQYVAVQFDEIGLRYYPIREIIESLPPDSE